VGQDSHGSFKSCSKSYQKAATFPAFTYSEGVWAIPSIRTAWGFSVKMWMETQLLTLSFQVRGDADRGEYMLSLALEWVKDK
jgi:hypothetical protein